MTVDSHPQRGRSCASCAHGTSASMHGGFTLLELLLVILIIGIILSFAALSIGRGNERAVEDEMKRLAGLIELAAQEATLASRELAVQFNGNKYEFLAFEDNKWARIANDDTFRPRTLPEEIRLIVRIEDEPVDLGTEDTPETGQETQNALPRIYLLSSGEITPFQLILQDATTNREGAHSYRIDGGINGKIGTHVMDGASTQ